MVFEFSLNLPFFFFFPLFLIVETAAALCMNRGGGRSSKRGTCPPNTFEHEFGAINEIKGGTWMCLGGLCEHRSIPRCYTLFTAGHLALIAGGVISRGGSVTSERASPPG